MKDANWSIYAPGGLGQQLETILAGQMTYQYFPIDLNALSANIKYHELGEGDFKLGPFQVTAQYLNHPSVTLGYRLEAGGASVIYAADHEPNSPHAIPPSGAESAGHLKRCNAGVSSMAVLADGNVTGCVQGMRSPEEAEGNVRETRLLDIWQQGFATCRASSWRHCGRHRHGSS